MRVTSRAMSRTCALLITAFVCILASMRGVSAADPPVYPVNSTDPVSVYVTMSVNFLGKLDGVEQQFNSDIYLTAYWCDPRLTAGRAFSTKTDWYPILEWVNARPTVSMVSGSPYAITKRDSINFLDASDSNYNCPMWGSAFLRYIGPFVSRLDLKAFPFDSQTVPFFLESSQYTNDQMAFKFATPPDQLVKNAIPDEFKVVEWTLFRDRTRVYITDNYYYGLNQNYSRFVFNIGLDRQPEYWLNKVVTIAVLVVIMSISLHVLAPEVPVRLVTCITTYMALINVVFVASNNLPKLAYLTRLDKFMQLCFFIVFAMNLTFALLFIERTAGLWAMFFGPWQKRLTNVMMSGVSKAVNLVKSEKNATSPEDVKIAPKFMDSWWTSIPITRRRDFLIGSFYSMAFLIATAVLLKT